MNPLVQFKGRPDLNYSRFRGSVKELERYMRIVFFSSDRLEVERIGQEFARAGIPNEVREGTLVKESELWIKKDADLHRAFLLCVELSVGFARRESTHREVEVYDESAAA